MKSAKKKRKLLTRKKVVKRTIKAKPAPRKRRKSRMSNIKKPTADEPKPAGDDPMGKPADSPPNPNLPPEDSSKSPLPPQPPRPSPMPEPKPAAE